MNMGDKVDDFSLPSTDGEFTLSAARGKTVVLYFYPKDDTPGCTIESGEFSALLDDFTAADAVVLGVSRDSIRAHNKFRGKFNYAHHLLADEEEKVCGQFGVMGNKTMFGKPARGIIRSTFIIDSAGRLGREWRGIKEAAGHAAEVLAVVRQMTKSCG